MHSQIRESSSPRPVSSSHGLAQLIVFWIKESAKLDTKFRILES